MEKQNKPETMTKGKTLGGVLLIVFGLILLADQVFDFHLGGYPLAVYDHCPWHFPVLWGCRSGG